MILFKRKWINQRLEEKKKRKEQVDNSKKLLELKNIEQEADQETLPKKMKR